MPKVTSAPVVSEAATAYRKKSPGSPTPTASAHQPRLGAAPAVGRGRPRRRGRVVDARVRHPATQGEQQHHRDRPGHRQHRHARPQRGRRRPRRRPAAARRRRPPGRAPCARPKPRPRPTAPAACASSADLDGDRTALPSRSSRIIVDREGQPGRPEARRQEQQRHAHGGEAVADDRQRPVAPGPVGDRPEDQAQHQRHRLAGAGHGPDDHGGGAQGGEHRPVHRPRALVDHVGGQADEAEPPHHPPGAQPGRAGPRSEPSRPLEEPQQHGGGADHQRDARRRSRSAQCSSGMWSKFIP